LTSGEKPNDEIISRKEFDPRGGNCHEEATKVGKGQTYKPFAIAEGEAKKADDFFRGKGKSGGLRRTTSATEDEGVLGSEVNHKLSPDSAEEGGR